MIGNIGVMGVAQTGGRLGGEGGGGEIQGPENHSGCVKVYTPGGYDPVDFGPVAGKIAARVWDAPAEDKGTASGAGHVVEAGTGVEVMAAAGASSNGGSPAAQAAGKDVVTGTNDEARTHRDLRGVIRSE
jgi:hypothetical protein